MGDAKEKAQADEQEFEQAKEEMRELEKGDPPDKLEDWPDGKAKYETYGGPDSASSYDEGPTSKLGPADLEYQEDGSIEIEGEKVDDPDEYQASRSPAARPTTTRRTIPRPDRMAAMPAIADLAGSDAERQEHIVAVLVDAFADLIERDPRAFRGKFRKMAADPFAFYRGSAPLFYSDVDAARRPVGRRRTSRVWIQGDLHAENYGTYMDSAGVLVFDVNDFDEAYLGHYTWDLQRMAASLALLGFRKALSDASIAELIETYARAYVDTVRLFATSEVDRDFRLTLDNTDGPLRACARGRAA